MKTLDLQRKQACKSCLNHLLHQLPVIDILTRHHFFRDAFALNIGPEHWQLAQARSAYRICSARRSAASTVDSTLKLFLSLDMNVLPSASREDMIELVDMVEELGKMDCQLTVNRRHASNAIWGEDVGEKTGKIVLSTFGGGEADFGGSGWLGFLQECKARDLNVSNLAIRSVSHLALRHLCPPKRSTSSLRSSFRPRRYWLCPS
jgi:hypothetical protein